MVNASADVTAGGTEKHDFELVASPGNVARAHAARLWANPYWIAAA